MLDQGFRVVSANTRPRLTLLAIGCVLVFSFMGSRSLWDTSEARYAEVAREMAVEGHWFVPHLIHYPHLTKPPFSYWLVALSIRLFGQSEWAVRIMVGVFFLGGVLITASLGTALLGSRAAGTLAGWLQLLSCVPLVASNIVTTDTFVATTELAFLWCAWRCLLASDDRRARPWGVAFYALVGLAFMTKGPPGMLMLVPLAVFSICYRREYRWRRLLMWSGLAVFLAIALPWYVAVLWWAPQALSVWKQEALTAPLVSGDRDMTWLAYIPILILGALPGSASIPWIGKDLVHKIRAREGVSASTAFLLLWIALPFVVFCLSKTRLPLYMLPLFPPVSLLGAQWLAARWLEGGEWNGSRIPRWAIGIGAAVALLSVGIKLIAGAYPPESRCFLPVAKAIMADAAEIGRNPTVVITMPFEGNALVYYLNDAHAVRAGHLPGAASHASSHIAAVMRDPVPDGWAQYLVMHHSKQASYRVTAGAFFEPVFENSKWAVWRRIENGAVDLPFGEFFRE
jgi:4-amino-4-deoxy-L-arabinose transferase-like glycosyltransferase